MEQCLSGVVAPVLTEYGLFSNSLVMVTDIYGHMIVTVTSMLLFWECPSLVFGSRYHKTQADCT